MGAKRLLVRNVFVGIGLVALAANAAAERREKPANSDVVKEGRIAVVRGVSRAEAQLTDHQGRRYLLTGALSNELLRLSGHTVKVWGVQGKEKLLTPTLRVDRYQIIDSGGTRPHVGRLLSDPKDKTGIILRKRAEVGEQRLRVSAKRPLARRLRQRLGCKVWIAGEVTGDTLNAYKFGWLNCDTSKPIKPIKNKTPTK
ncbi:MAG: hypothetical protein H6707_03465 [Deltaproteobacteria bacterium]|nr:hypothetical protein [Deltaproteobacteria bacterium]